MSGTANVPLIQDIPVNAYWLLGRLRIQERTEEAGPVVEVACVTDVQRISSIPLHGVSSYYVSRSEGSTVRELCLRAKLDRPFGKVGIRRVIRGEPVLLNLYSTDLVAEERIKDLLASAQA